MMQQGKILPLSFYQNPDVVGVSRALLGKYLMTEIAGVVTGGMIVETEAYCGETDKACHAHLNRRTKRTEIMFGPAGHAYVYLCYGIHHLFNIVTNVEGKADAVLVRAIEPQVGIDTMLERREMAKLSPRLTGGPGSLSKALGITTSHYGTALTAAPIWIEDRGIGFEGDTVVASPRVGVDYAGDDAALPWRFRVKGNKWCSPAK